MSSNNGELAAEINESIGEITFSHPKSNSLPGELLRKIARTIEEFAAKPEVKVLLLKSAGEKAFCAGASFEELLAVETPEESVEFFSGFSEVIQAMRNCPKFVVTRVQGKAVGGGVGLIAASDYVLATDKAAIKLSELELGIGPFIIGPAVERKVGPAAFAELAIEADWRSAEWAHEHGLFNRKLCSSIAELDSQIAELTKRLAGFHLDAMTKLKEATWQSTESWNTLLPERVQTTSRLALSDYVQNKVASFKAGGQKTSAN